MNVVEWLLDSDPAIRWQVMGDLVDAPEEDVAAECGRVATAAAEWWHSLPPARQGTLFPEWTSTAWSLMLLRSFGLEPVSAIERHGVRRVREHCRWEHDGEPFFAGEVEPCINGKVVAIGAYFGENVRLSSTGGCFADFRPVR